MSRWFDQQFGDTATFALRLAFHTPATTAAEAPDLAASWGTVELWANSRCLTRSVDAAGTQADGVTWHLRPLLEWLADHLPALINEEPLPLPVALDGIGDAADWLDASETPLVTLSDSEEDDWFERRSSWRERHALRAGLVDAALPMILIRRVGAYAEIAWDNERWGTSRPTVTFTERRGRALVEVQAVAHTLLCALEAAPGDGPWRERTLRIGGGARNWRLLLHPDVVEAVELVPGLVDRIDGAQRGLVALHTPETLALRSFRRLSPPQVERIVAAVAPSDGARSPRIEALRAPSPADGDQPWLRGYEAATTFRAEVGWNGGPATDLPRWLDESGVVTRRAELGGATVLTVRPQDGSPRVVLTPDDRRDPSFRLATALGHLLLDPEPVAVDGPLEHWPTAARARAFAAMLLMPEDGVRALLRSSGGTTPDGVRAVMSRYGTSASATTWHLQNLRFIGAEDRATLMGALGG